MKNFDKYQFISRTRSLLKYLVLFILCYALLFLDLNFYLVLAVILLINILFVKIELKFHLATQLAKLIKEEKFDDALSLGLMKNAEQKDDYSKLLMLTAYYKTGRTDEAMQLLKNIDQKKWKTKKVNKILDNWKIKMLLDSPYQLN
ncbi:MAG: hypothetical protein ACLFQM_00320 [Fidelibacterota bacterium]